MFQTGGHQRFSLFNYNYFTTTNTTTRTFLPPPTTTTRQWPRPISEVPTEFTTAGTGDSPTVTIPNIPEYDYDYDTEFDDDDDENNKEEEEEEEEDNDAPRFTLNSDDDDDVASNERSPDSLPYSFSFDEITTPTSTSNPEYRGFHFQSTTTNQQQQQHGKVQSVVGPRGPHLFRASIGWRSSIQLQESDPSALSLSPLSLSPLQLSRIPPKVPPKSPSRYQLGRFKVPPISAIPAEILHRNTHHRPTGSILTDDAVTALDKREVAAWTPRQVARWMNDAGMEPAIVEKFQENDISGAILITLKFEDLRELDIPSLADRHKLWEEFHHLRTPGSLPATSRPPTPIDEVESPLGEEKSAFSARQYGNTQEMKEDVAPRPRPRPKNSRRRRRVQYEDVIFLNRKDGDVISPLDSVSIVGIEQLVPKPHSCHKGEDCPKWRKQQQVIAAFKKEHPEGGGRIWIAGEPSNPDNAPSLRPFFDAMTSAAASSEVHQLEAESLRTLASRDPQDNVRQFLNLQHLAWHQQNQGPQTIPPYEMFPPVSPNLPAPHQGLRALPKLAIPRTPPARSACAKAFAPYRMDRAEATSPELQNATKSPPISTGKKVYRFGTPFLEMDLPFTAANLGPVARDASQSVPPSMSFRKPVTANNGKNGSPPNSNNQHHPPSPYPSNRRTQSTSSQPHQNNQPHGPSPLRENTTASSAATWSTPPIRSNRTSSPEPAAKHEIITARQVASAVSPKNLQTKIKEDAEQYPYPPQHQGTMRIRRTGLLRNEWREYYFTLRGTRLGMHSDSRALDTLSSIDIDDYAVACCAGSSSSKLNAAFRALSFTQWEKDKDEETWTGSGSGSESGKDLTASTFQLIPAARERGDKLKKARDLFWLGGVEKEKKLKVLHFAVGSRDEMIDWMRELMLVKALRKKVEGYQINLNGEMI